MRGKNGPAAFLPFSRKIGGNDGKARNNNNTGGAQCLMPKQTKYMYKKGELGSLINKETMKNEIDLDVELDRVGDESGDENPYKELIVNNAIKMDRATLQMEHLSILSNVINYVQYSKNPKDFHSKAIKPVNNRRLNLISKDRNEDDMSLRVDLTDALNGSKEEYLDRYEGVISEVLNTTRFDKNTDLNTTYEGKLRMTQGDKLNVEERFWIMKQGYTVGKLLDSTECQILLDTRASKSFMSKSYHLHCKSLHSLPKFASKTQRIQVGNGQHVSILFVILIIVHTSSHIFEISTLASEIHENIDLVLDIKICLN